MALLLPSETHRRRTGGEWPTDRHSEGPRVAVDTGCDVLYLRLITGASSFVCKCVLFNAGRRSDGAVSQIRADLSPDLIKGQFSKKTRRTFAFKSRVIAVCSIWGIVRYQQIKYIETLVCSLQNNNLVVFISYFLCIGCMDA